jgi:predicted ATP-binding protein involved in virulence
VIIQSIADFKKIGNQENQMRIDQIKMKNFKCFKHKTLQFSPRFNVLSGDNGTGKTAVLDALAVGMGALLLGFNCAKRRHIRPHEMRHVGYYMGQNLKVEPQPPTKLHYLGELNHSGTIRWERRLMTKDSPTATKTWGENSMRDLTKELQKRVQAGDNTVILPLLSYYGTCHLCLQLPANPGDFITPDSRLAIYRDCLNPVSYGEDMRRWFKTMEVAALQREVPMGVLEGLRKAVKTCLEGCEQVYYDLEHDSLLVQFTNGKTIPDYMLSDGQRTILGLVADIAHKAASLNPQLEEQAAVATPGIVLIDELDLHIHPNWQRRIVKNLKTTFPNLQFITTSHSPFIIQSLDAGELIDLNEHNAEYADKSIEDIAEQVMGVTVPQRSQRYLEMMKAAKDYYRLLETAKNASPVEKERLKNRLDELAAPFSDNIAYHAFLELQREVAGLGGGNANAAS